jgi:hypothetical protein
LKFATYTVKPTEATIHSTTATMAPGDTQRHSGWSRSGANR